MTTIDPSTPATPSTPAPPAPEQPMLKIPRSAQPVPTEPRHTNRRIPVAALLGVVLVLAAALVLGATRLGWFQTKGGYASGSETGVSADERVAPSAGAPTADIKGWMTIQQVLDAYPVTKAALFARFAVPADTSTETTLSELKESGTSTLDIPTLRSWIDDGAPATTG